MHYGWADSLQRKSRRKEGSILAALYTSSRDAKSLAVFRQCIQSILYITKRPFDGGLESLLPVPECVVTLSGQD